MNPTCLAILVFLSAPDDRSDAIRKGVALLKKTQDKDGHWGGQYSAAITGMAGLALLAAGEEPAKSEELLKAVKWLLSQIQDGRTPKQGHTWVHGQGFATLFLAEYYGRASAGRDKPDLDLRALKRTVAACVKAIEACQSSTGGWWYTPDRPGAHEHEGSTTVCAVQALRAASNYGIAIDEKVIEKGFEYLKNTQNADGSFQYRLGDGSHMKEGTAAAVATLALMSKLDYPVLINGAKYLKEIGHDGITRERFPFYGHFYSVLGMKLVAEEMDQAVPHAKEWHKPVVEWLLKDQKEDGRWDLRGWMLQNGGEGGKHDYSTALGVLILAVHDERLSIFKREPPETPGRKAYSIVRDWRSADVEERDRATKALRELGVDALPAVREALKHRDPEVRARAKELLEHFPVVEQWTGEDSKIQAAEAVLIRDMAAWIELWKRHSDKEAPKVDFGRHQVLAVFHGELHAFAGGKYGITGIDVTQEKAVVTVERKWISPSGVDKRTTGFAIVVFDRDIESLKLVRVSRRGGLGGDGKETAETILER
ncbi:MAG: hypothetical protein HYY17_00410 [Planctomycetes bacterium]|nr:hypothetical protein [Planctomycetota bacterium]